MDIPMLDDEEFEQVGTLMSDGARATKKYRETHGVPLSGLGVGGFFVRAREEYRRITGFDESNHNAIWHHRISLYGPPCSSCGKPLRTPQAKACAACGAYRDAI